MSDEELIVWNGIIAEYGAIKHFIDEEDELRLATKQDIIKYQTKNVLPSK